MSVRLGNSILAGKALDALPDQSGQNGKFLTTNGTTASWNTVAGANADNISITTNSSDRLQTVGVLNQSDTTKSIKMWTGTTAEYNALTSIDPNTLYNITDDTTEIESLHNVGDIFYSMRAEDNLNGAVVCDGSSYAIADYNEGSQSIKTLLDSGKLPYVSISDFDAMVTAKGSCRCFGYDGSSATTFKVPKLNDVFVEAGTAATPSEFVDAGLPNITGIINSIAFRGGSGTTWNGAFTPITMVSYGGYGSSTGETLGSIQFDASLSNSIYGNSNTVQPNAVKYRAFIQLANGVSDSALQNVSTLMNQMEETVNYKNITNCITEIPQDIKLELSSGTLTLKAGSKVYVPNGVDIFQTVTIDSDIVISATGGSGSVLACVNSTGLAGIASGVNNCVSGPGVTPVNYGMCYDTTANTIVRYGESGCITYTRASFPIALCTQTNGVITSIDQIFNGFGYIGSTIFVLPGVKGLVPNGKNADGTLKNTEISYNTVATQTRTDWGSSGITNLRKLQLHNNFINGIMYSNIYYDEETNYNYRIDNGTIVSTLITSILITNGNNISYLKAIEAFHSLDYNDGSFISKCFIPSSKYIELTLGTTGSDYIAPANGWFGFRGAATSTSAIGHIEMRNYKTSLDINGSTSNSSSSNIVFRCSLPVKKGDSVRVWYSNVSSSTFGFMYAEGEL